MKKTLYTILALLFCMGVLLCLGSAAWAETHSGTWGALHWTLDNDGLLTISGSGAMNDIYGNQEPNTWLAYRNEIVTAVVEEGVTSIGYRAFYNCENLTGVTIPATMTGSIGHGAFEGCPGLTAITVDPENTAYSSADGVLFSKDGETLVRCPEGKTGTYAIPADVTSIGSEAFYSCTSLTRVTIPEGVTGIGMFAFEGCESLTSVTIPAGVTYIGGYAFESCISLKSVTISAGVTSIGDHAFFGCGSLESITLPAGVTSIGDYAFDSSNNLESVTFTGTEAEWNAIDFGDGNGPLMGAAKTFLLLGRGDWGALHWTLDNDGLLTISGSGAMNDIYSNQEPNTWLAYRNEIVTAVVEEGVTSIGSNAFCGCTGLTGITIPAGVKSIGDAAFDGCTDLESVTIPAGVTSIGVWAFSDCSSLTELTIPSGVMEIRSCVFCGCTGLTSITLPAGVMSIGDSAFNGCSGLTEILLPSSVTAIGESAFECCSNLTELTIPEGVTGIMVGTFCECDSLQSITIPASVNFIGDYAFQYCGLLEVHYGGTEADRGNISIGSDNDVLEEAMWAFAADDGAWGRLHWTVYEDGLLTISGRGPMNNITVNQEPGWLAYRDDIVTAVVVNGVTSIGQGAFSGCESLESVTIPASVTSIGSEAFYGCWSLTSVTIPAGVTYIGEYAFSGCGSLTSVTIPASVTSIVGSVFESDSKLTAITVSAENNYYKSIDGVLFEKDGKTLIRCPEGKTGTYAIPSDVMYIDANAFRFCRDLTGITLPSDVSFIGNSAFEGCESLESVTFTGTEAEWNAMSIGSGNGALTGAPKTFLLLDRGAWGSLSWTLDKEGLLTISGSGAMNNFTEDSTAAWNGHKSDIHSVVIEPGVTSIGEYAFYNSENLQSVTIPASVTGIGQGAFEGCSALTAITVDPENTAYSSAAGVLFSKDGKTLVRCPEGKTGTYAIPADVTSIGSEAFWGCSGLTEITIPADVTSIGSYAFYACGGLTEVTIPAGVTYIGGEAFSNCGSLTEIQVDAANNHFSADDGVLFNKEKTTVLRCPAKKQGAYTIPESVTDIGYHAFCDCGSLTSVTIPASLTDIGEHAFYNCAGLESVTIRAGVTSIGIEAFYCCESLESITIPASVTSIEEGAFFGCGSLSSVRYDGTAAEWEKISIGSNNAPLLDAEFYCEMIAAGDWGNLRWTLDNEGLLTISGSGALDDIPSNADQDTWLAYRDDIVTAVLEEGVTSLGNRAFYRCTALESVTLPASLTGPVGQNAFNLCSALTAIAADPENTAYGSADGVLFRDGGETLVRCPEGKTGTYAIPAGVTDIGDWAFAGCSGLTEITIPAGVTGVGASAFNGCTGLTEITIPAGVTDVGASAFYGCVGLTGVTIGEGVTAIGEDAFNGCRKLQSITLPANLTAIGDSAFRYCESLESVTIPAGVTAIGGNVFSFCRSLMSVTIPAGVTSIGYAAFFNCAGLTDVWYGGPEAGWRTISIASCNEPLANAELHCFEPDFTLPNALTAIGEEAFQGGAFTFVKLPENAVTIGARAFADCPNLAYIYIPAATTGIDENAFAGVTGLTIIGVPDSPAAAYAQAHGYAFVPAAAPSAPDE